MSLADPIADTSRARSDAVAWLRSLFPELELPPRASDDELRLRLADGAVLCEVLRRLCPASLDEGRATAATENDNVRRFIAAVERMGLPIFRVSDLEAGSMAGVVACLLVLRDRFGSRAGEGQNPSFLGRSDSDGGRRWRLAENNRIESMEFSIRENAQAGQERKQMGAKLQRVLRSPVMPEPTSPLSWSEPSSLSRHAGYKFHEVFQLKQGGYSNLPAAKISEMIKSTSLDNAPTQSLLSVVNGILDESIEHKSGEIPYRVACLLRKVILEIERRISTQAEHIRNQNNLIKAREEKYQSRIRVLEALASRTSVQTPANSSATTGQTHVATDRVQLKKMNIDKDDDKRPLLEEDMTRLMKDKEDVVRLTKEKEDMVSLLKEKEYIIRLMKEETAKLMEEKEDMVSLKKSKVEETKQSAHQDADRLIKEKDDIIRLMKEEKDASNQTIIKLKQELEAVGSSYEESCRLLESKKQGVIKQSADENTDMSIKDDIVRLMKEKQDNNRTIMKLKQELEAVRSLYDERCRLLESNKEDVIKLRSDKEHSESIISQLRQELEATKRSHEAHRQQLDIRAAQANKEFEQKVKQAELMLEDSSKRRTELEVLSESRIRTWKQKEFVVNQFVGLQTQNVQGLRLTSVSIRHEILNCQKRWSEELAGFGQRLKVLTNAAENYNAVAAENRKLFNEVQELKGNIRVYCRIRPFLPGEDQKSTSIEYIGDNGELILANPAKQGKEGKKEFTFNKVFGPSATQDEVFKDIQPLIRSVLDGYNVCIFAYGQTGSGKTYTMTGPENATEKEWGVNYRALNDLFNISSSRGDTITYEICVQMIEIYNEQIRDLIGNGGSQKKLGILTTSQPNGLAVPDATMCPVNSTSHVIELMQTGHNNRAMSATALNERSSRSHSVVTIHVKGLDLKTGATLRGSLHLVDLAGSERVDRSAVIGDRLKEAQHINKSLSALGDVVFSLSQKNAHVPYRNSKLTQILQSSLGGHAKTLMFVQVNPDVSSYTETLSTLKFAERVSGVELGVARTNKEGKDVRELMEQLSLLKDTIAKKDEEIDRLQLLKTHTPRLKTVRQADSLLKHSSSSPGISSLGGKAKSVGTGVVSDSDNLSDTSDRHSEAGSMQSVDDLRQQREIMGLSKLSAGETGQSSADTEFPGFGDANSEGRLSDMSDGDLSMSTETDGSLSSVMEVGPFTQQEKAPTTLKEPKMTTRVQKTASLKASLSSNLRLKPRDPPAPRSSMPTGLRRSTTTQATPSPRTTSTSKRGA